MDWEKIINWDEVPEDTVIYKNKETNALAYGRKGQFYFYNEFEEIKRPIKLEDGAWYAFTYDGVKRAGVFYGHNHCLQAETKFYYIADVKVHKKIADDMWE